VSIEVIELSYRGTAHAPGNIFIHAPKQAVFDHYIDRVVVDCVNQLTPKWSSRLAAFDVYIWDQCYSIEQSLRID
jgi:hypothetical protein